ncbi:MAG: hypothetical protein HQL03_02425 [Nitrospirae bacterium]|nr:hypothetical protein [Nitrospirota bacterium]
MPLGYSLWAGLIKKMLEDELISTIQECLPDLYLKPQDAKDILKEISTNHGLLKEQAYGWYSFIHLTVQEYFTACDIYERRNYDIAIGRGQGVHDPLQGG